ncbi:protein eyes shut homolog [Sceloporus undulatus]|uniref:protein eyes shut homolog n=1 Tax=Sceloporus undulatus TaxID=8520 RepID=UPI001C4D0FCF|nr:protein eyes shut homolog [Sceloporus undulatus]
MWGPTPPSSPLITGPGWASQPPIRQHFCVPSLLGIETHACPAWLAPTCGSLTPGSNKASPGFTGEFCETNIGGCRSHPCGALSLCKDELDGYHCFCAPGFIGNNCDTEVDECLSYPCHNGGTCIEHLNAFNCLCSHGFQGTLCEININECHSNPCLHNSTCTDLISGYDCSCLPGFTGLHCETDIDECASSPCKNGGTCIDQPGNYYCQCVAPFKGLNCEFRPCEGGNPCENGAVCLKEMDLAAFPLGFQCQCKKGFAGPRCEININECSSNPCLHGYCYDVVDGFYCLCNPGYAGQKCDQDIDDCINNACKHNSTCMDLHLVFRSPPQSWLACWSADDGESEGGFPGLVCSSAGFQPNPGNHPANNSSSSSPQLLPRW